MKSINRFSLTLESLAKLAAEPSTVHSAPQPAIPTLSSVLAEFTPLPINSLFLGLATDGLPVLLNLLDPIPGPIIIVGDAESGKTQFLQTIADSVDQIYKSGRVKYIVISRDATSWNDRQESINCEQILAENDLSSATLLTSLVEQAHSNKNNEQITLLLIDEFEALISVPEMQQEIRWLLLRGPSKRIWPIVTIDSSSAVSEAFQPWLEAFRTRLFGYMADDRYAQYLTGVSHISLTHIMAGSEFVMRDGNDWLPFWIPSLD